MKFNVAIESKGTIVLNVTPHASKRLLFSCSWPENPQLASTLGSDEGEAIAEFVRRHDVAIRAHLNPPPSKIEGDGWVAEPAE